MTTNELLYMTMLRSESKRFCSFQKDIRIDSALQEVTGHKADDLGTKDRHVGLVIARHLGMFFYLKAGYSLNVSGKRFNRDHAMVIYARKQIEKYYGMKAEKKLTDMVDEISKLTGIKFKDD